MFRYIIFVLVGYPESHFKTSRGKLILIVMIMKPKKLLHIALFFALFYFSSTLNAGVWYIYYSDCDPLDYDAFYDDDPDRSGVMMIPMPCSKS